MDVEIRIDEYIEDLAYEADDDSVQADPDAEVFEMVYSEEIAESLKEKAKTLKSRSEVAAIAFVALTENGTVALDKAAEHPDMFDAWEAGAHYTVGNIRLYGEYLYQCRQEHDAQAQYTPDIIPALWERIPKPHEGEHDTPIPYDASIGMALTEGLYYSEDGSLYVCTRSSVNPVYGPLSGLAGIFAELAE